MPAYWIGHSKVRKTPKPTKNSPIGPTPPWPGMTVKF